VGDAPCDSAPDASLGNGGEFHHVVRWEGLTGWATSAARAACLASRCSAADERIQAMPRVELPHKPKGFVGSIAPYSIRIGPGQPLLSAFLTHTVQSSVPCQ
jgi:hypothetical protein